MIVKHGDIYPVTWTVNMDLTDATVRVLARLIGASETIELTSIITDPTGGVLTHTLSGDLPVGGYHVEVEVTAAGLTVTFPTNQNPRERQYDLLTVVADLD